MIRYLMQIVKEIEDFEIKHKIIFFSLTLLLTILITRIIVFIKDPNILLFGYELHHFYYGIILLLITNLFILFGHRNYKVSLILSGIGIGLILDEFIFVMGKFDNTEYFSTIPSALLFFLFIICLTIIIEKSSRKKIKNRGGKLK